MKQSHKENGFSLVEVLVVMGIIMMLAGLALPIYHKYRAYAYSLKCQANLRCIGVAMAAYQGDWHGWFPYALDNFVRQTDKQGKAVRWKYELSYYMGNYTIESRRGKTYPLHPAFVDPIKGKGEGNYFISSAHFGERIWIYGDVPAAYTGNYGSTVQGWYPYTEWTNKEVNGRVVTNPICPKGYMFFGSWKSPETAAVVTDAASPTLQRGYAYDAVKKVVNVDYRHNGKANVLFLDGHVQEFGETDKNLYADPKGAKPGGYFDKKVLESINMWQEPPTLKGPKYLPPSYLDMAAGGKLW